MKTNFYIPTILFFLIAIESKAQNANTTLSNLTPPTAVNANLYPDKDNRRTLGSPNKAWRNLYLDSAIYFRDSLCFHILGTYTGIGENALKNSLSYTWNTATGYYALYANTSGTNNTAAGAYALGENTTGTDNIATGSGALYNNSTGSGNTGFGAQALWRTNGNYNTAVGYEALLYNRGSNNVALGALALGSDETNLDGQVAVGYSALYNLVGGSGHCTAVGSEAGYNNTSGSQNTYVGYHAGNTVTSGSSNTTIGYGADVGNGTFTNATAIGNLAVVDASNHIHIGNSSVTKIGGQVSWSTFSDARIKNNIQQNVPGLVFINLLKPLTYHFDLNKQEAITGRKDSAEWKEKYDIQKIQFTGFLAQDVEKAAKQINYDFSGVDVPKDDKSLYSLSYSDFVVPLVKGEQELSKQNDSLKSIVNSLQNQINELKAMIVSNQSMPVPLNAGVNGQQSTVLSSISLSQNNPNPFSNSTTINYFIPQQYSSAKIIITDKNGNTVKKQINVSSGKGSVSLDASSFTSGAYQYSLYVDGRLIDTKQMIMSK